MNKGFWVIIVGIAVLSATSNALAEGSSWGSTLKSTAQSVVGQASVQQLSPQAQSVVDQAKKLGAPAKQENFIIAKAKEYLASGNYKTALDLGNYVKTMLNSKSFDAGKIIADAQGAITKMMQQKPTAVQ
ncbi:MAG: hypothetical protein NTZ63_00450 [Candidatus Omnitrophica bacterium]|nr:hypothetical protein [Candidatus Omnitrophota bacterium]